PDRVLIYDSGAGNVWGFATGKGEFGFSGIKDIVIDTGGGDDHVEYYLVGDLVAHSTRSVDVNLRDGNDSFSANLKNPFTNQSSNFQVGAELLMKVVGEAGNDTLLFNADHVAMHQATMKIAYYGGDGNDTIGMGYAGLLDHGGVSFFAYGEAGRDLIGQFYNVDPASVAPHPPRIPRVLHCRPEAHPLAFCL